MELSGGAMKWLTMGSKGISSQTMFSVCTGLNIMGGWHYDHPFDSDDFSRCYDVYKSVPEVRENLNKLREVSNAWNNLIDNWDILCSKFEENTRTNWRMAKDIGLQKLIRELTRKN